jgi:O-antigen/teichoic acid export membrane protein
MLTAALKRLGKHSLIYALGPAVQKVIGFALLPFITHWIGTRENYGIVEMAAVTLAVAGQCLGINLLHGMSRFYAEYESERERQTLVSTTMWILIGTTGAAFVLAWAFPSGGAKLLFDSPEYANALVVVAAILVLQCVGQVGLRWLQLLERSITYGVLTTIKMLVEVGLKVWFLVEGLTYMGVLYSVLGGEAVIAVGLLVYLLVKVGPRFSTTMARRLWRYSAPLVLSGLAGFVLHQGDRFFVQHLVGPGELGLYGLSYKLGTIANTVLLEAFGMIWFPFVFGLKRAEEVELVTRRVMTYFALLMAFASLALCLFARETVAVMADADFADAYRAMPPIIAGYYAWAVYQVASTVFYLEQRTALLSFHVLAAAGVNLAANFTLVPRYGAMGAAWATCLTFVVLATSVWIHAERLRPMRFELPRVLGPALLGFGLYVASERLPASLSTGAALAVRAALLAAFPLLLLVLGYLRPEEKAKIRGMLDRRRTS